MNKFKNMIKRIVSPCHFGLMVVNGNYYRPMANKENNLINPALSDEKYFEICEQIRKG